MPLTFNIRHLETKPLVLQGELTAEELKLNDLDELIEANQPLSYSLELQRQERSILVQGSLGISLHCQCARCLKPFVQRIELPNWTSLLVLEGEESVAVVNDCVDLTPVIREDILLAFPQHPLCEEDCSGLPEASLKNKPKSGAGPTPEISSTWAELNKLKF